MMALLFIVILLGTLEGCGPPSAGTKFKSEFVKKQDIQEKLAKASTKYEIQNVKVNQGSVQFDFKMDNNSDLALKDFMIFCYPADKTGKKLDRRYHIIHQIVPAKSSKTFSSITLNIDPQANAAQCELIYYFFGQHRVWLKKET